MSLRPSAEVIQPIARSRLALVSLRSRTVSSRRVRGGRRTGCTASSAPSLACTMMPRGMLTRLLAGTVTCITDAALSSSPSSSAAVW